NVGQVGTLFRGSSRGLFGLATRLRRHAEPPSSARGANEIGAMKGVNVKTQNRTSRTRLGRLWPAAGAFAVVAVLTVMVVAGAGAQVAPPPGGLIYSCVDKNG